MITAFPRTLVSVLPLALLAACGPESDQVVFEMQAQSFAGSEWSEPVNLGPAINTSFNEQQAMLSKDGLTLYFASNRPGTSGSTLADIWVAQRACLDCPWESPVNLGAPVNTAVSEAAPALSRDEHWLFVLATNRPEGIGSGDIWASYRDDVHDDLAWQEPINLGAGINTTGFEGGPSYFENDEGGGAQLYFNHNPAPVNTGGDIYVSAQAADGSWGDAVPVTELNSAASEQRPSISHDGRTIYFFSNRPGSNSDDIWVATRADVASPWTAPINLGAPINTEADERHPFIYSHGKTEMLFFARNVATPPAIDLDLFVSTRTRGGNAP
jgi:hypothetical protein